MAGRKPPASAVSRQPPAASRQATEGEAAALAAVYEKLAELLDALRDARAQVRHEALLAVINDEIDRLLAADDQLRKAIVEYTGKPVGDPY